MVVEHKPENSQHYKGKAGPEYYVPALKHAAIVAQARWRRKLDGGDGFDRDMVRNAPSLDFPAFSAHKARLPAQMQFSALHRHDPGRTLWQDEDGEAPRRRDRPRG